MLLNNFTRPSIVSTVALHSPPPPTLFVLLLVVTVQRAQACVLRLAGLAGLAAASQHKRLCTAALSGRIPRAQLLLTRKKLQPPIMITVPCGLCTIYKNQT